MEQDVEREENEILNENYVTQFDKKAKGKNIIY
jgi:hypothetical protein